MTQSDPSFAAALKPAIAIAPMNRMGTAEEVAAACLWLCGDGAGFVCGHALVSPFPFILIPSQLHLVPFWEEGFEVTISGRQC